MMAASQNQPPHLTFHLWIPAYQRQMEEEQEKIKNCIVLAIISLFNASLSPLTPAYQEQGQEKEGKEIKKAAQSLS